MNDNISGKFGSGQADQHSMCHEKTKPEYMAQMFFLLFMTIATVVGNSAICCSIYHSQILHRFSNYLVMSLALSDLMVAFFSLPMRIHESVQNMNWCLSEGTCIFWIWVDLACRCTCFANLAVISVDRFVATRYPLRYHRIITQRGSHLMLVYIWFHGVAIASLGLYNWSTPVMPAFAIDNPLGCRKTPDPMFYTFATCIGFLAPLLIISASYSYVFSISWQHWKSTNLRTLPEQPFLVQGDVACKRFALKWSLTRGGRLPEMVAYGKWSLTENGHLREMIAYGKWSLTRGQTTEGLNFESYEPVVISIYKAPIGAKYCIILKF